MVKTTYFIPPPIINSTYTYQNINKDYKLRAEVTDYFFKKSIKWNFIKKTDDNKIIYKLLKQIRRKENLNWYDLRSNKLIVKKYFALFFHT